MNIIAKVKNESKFIDATLIDRYDKAGTEQEERKYALAVLKAYNDALRNCKSVNKFINLLNEAYNYGIILKVKRPSKEGHFGFYDPKYIKSRKVVKLLCNDGVSVREIKWETAYKYYQFKTA